MHEDIVCLRARQLHQMRPGVLGDSSTNCMPLHLKLLKSISIFVLSVTDDATASENDTLGGVDYGTRGMGVCADPGSYRWCQALSRSRSSCATNTNLSTGKQQQPQSDTISESIRAESTAVAFALGRATAIHAASTQRLPPKTAAFTVKATSRRHCDEDNDVAEDVDGCASASRTCHVSGGSIKTLIFLLIWLLALLAKNAQAHNIPGKRHLKRGQSKYYRLITRCQIV